MNLIFLCSGKYFAPSVSILLSINSRGVGRGVSIEDWGKYAEYLSLHLLTAFHHCVSGALHLLWPSFSSSHTCRNPSCYSLCPLPVSVLACPWPSSPHPYVTNLSLYSSQVPCPSFHHLCIYFFPFSLTSSSLISHADPLPPLPNFFAPGDC